MAQAFEAGRAAFDAFRKRGRSGVLSRAAGVYLAISLLMGLVFVLLCFEGMIAYMRWGQELESGLTPPPPSVVAMFGMSALYAPVGFALLAAFEAACLRWLTRGEAGGGLFGLKIDAAFWLVVFCYLTWLPILLGNAVVSSLIAGVGIVLGRVLGGGLIGFLVGFLAVAAALTFSIGVAVKFAPAAALSVARRRYAFFEAWGATRGRTLALLGAFLIIIALFVLALLITGLVAAGPNLALANAMREAATPAEVFGVGPGVLASVAVATVVNAALQIVAMIALFGANAALAREASPPAESRGAEPEPLTL